MPKVELEGKAIGPDTDSNTKRAVEKWCERRGGTEAMEKMAKQSEPFAMTFDSWHGRNEYVIVVDLLGTPGWRSKPVGSTLRRKQAERVVNWFGSIVEDIERVDPSEIQLITNEIFGS